MNPVLKILGISHPIIQGGMGNISSASLAAAVSNAGGLGMIGSGTMSSKEMERIILQTKNRTNRPFGVNIALSVSPNVKDLIDLVIHHQVPVVSLSAGNPSPYISILKEHDCTILCVVASVTHAKKAEQAGVDLLIGEGFEAAGINSPYETTTFTLIPQLVKATKLPIIAAGGIGDGKGLAAALALGASGIQMGTRLIATKESMVHENYVTSVLGANDHATLMVGKSIGRLRRVLPSSYTIKAIELEKKGLTLEGYNQLFSEEHHVLGALEGKLDEGFINGGQIAGLIDDIPSVNDLFQKMIADAKKSIERVQSMM